MKTVKTRHGRKRRPLLERFLDRYVLDAVTGCWNWTTGMHKGYGVINSGGYRGAQLRAHRVAYANFVGQIPDGLNVLHRCDNPSCVNPAHLFLGTDADNMSDRDQKGRVARGEKNGKAKLTAAQILMIADASGTQKEIANTYGISNQHVSRIKRGFRQETNKATAPQPAPFEYCPPLDRICPWCGAKHTGYFQACASCQAAIGRGE